MVHTIFDSEGNSSVAPAGLNANVLNGIHGKSQMLDKSGHPSFSAVTKKNVQEMNPSKFNLVNPEITYEGDSAYVSLPKEFLLQARKRWTSSSCIGHFVGGGFSFKFVKERVMKLWANNGLHDVFYSPKGYFTFEFNTESEMKAVLVLNSVNIGGKRLYLAPWTDGSQFQKNVIPSVTTWIKLVNVHPTLWNMTGLGSLAKAIRKPLALDAQTAKLKPMKYAGILVDLRYSCSYPRFVWAPVLNDDGETVHTKVEVEYSALPSSCSFCKAFGHSLARCSLKPSVVTESVSDFLDKHSTKVDTQKGTNSKQSKGFRPQSEPSIAQPEPDSSKMPIESNPTQVLPDDSVPTLSIAEPVPVIITDSVNKMEYRHCDGDADSDAQNDSDDLCDGDSDIPTDSDNDNLAEPETEPVSPNYSLHVAGSRNDAASVVVTFAATNTLEDGEASTSNRVSGQDGDEGGFSQVQSKHTKRNLRSRGKVTKTPLVK